MLTKYSDQSVCFGVSRKKGRFPINISALVNIKQEILTDLDALQLFQVNARKFTSFFLNYEVKNSDKKGNKYIVTLIKSAYSDHSFFKENEIKIQAFAESMTKVLLELLEKNTKNAVFRMILTFALEIYPGIQLWLLGANEITLLKKDTYKNSRLGLINKLKPTKSCGNFILIPKEINKFSRSNTTERQRLRKNNSLSEQKFIKNSSIPERRCKSRMVSARKKLNPENFFTNEIIKPITNLTISRNPNSKPINNITSFKTLHVEAVKTVEKPKKAWNIYASVRMQKNEKINTHYKNFREADPVDTRQNLFHRFKLVKTKTSIPTSLPQPIEIKEKPKTRNVKMRTSLYDEKTCFGDFCKFHYNIPGCADEIENSPVKTDKNNKFPILYAIDALLINVGRLRMFSPYENPAIIQPVSTYIQTNTNSSPLAIDPEISFPIFPDDELNKYGPGEERIKFLVKVKKNMTNEQMNEMLAKIKNQVIYNENSLNSIPAGVIRLIKRHANPQNLDVCSKCRAIYVNILRYLAKIILGVND